MYWCGKKGETIEEYRDMREGERPRTVEGKPKKGNTAETVERGVTNGGGDGGRGVVYVKR